VPKLDIAYDQDKINTIQKELDDLVGFQKSGITLNHTPYNKVTQYTIAIWALGRTEEENQKIMNEIKAYLQNKNYESSEYESYIIWDEGKIYIEIPVEASEE
jgi:hypothetical protein